MVIDNADKNLLADEAFQIDDHRSQILFLKAGGLPEDDVVPRLHQLDARLIIRPAADQKTGIRLGHLEWNRRERALWLITCDLECANPILAAMLALHIRAARGGRVAFYWLVISCH